MMLKIILVIGVCTFASIIGMNPKYEYPELYRDHVYYNLTEKGREIFFAVNVHPDCVKKHGECIKREKCIGKKYLYISRICYTRDLVCCYDDTIKHPVVEYISSNGRPVTTPAPTPGPAPTPPPSSTPGR